MPVFAAEVAGRILRSTPLLARATGVPRLAEAPKEEGTDDRTGVAITVAIVLGVIL
jgi:hypothetical protein